MYCVSVYNRRFHVLPFTFINRSRSTYLSNRLYNLQEPQMLDPSAVCCGCPEIKALSNISNGCHFTLAIDRHFLNLVALFIVSEHSFSKHPWAALFQRCIDFAVCIRCQVCMLFSWEDQLYKMLDIGFLRT